MMVLVENQQIKMVAEGVKLYQENECDFLIGLGGGSQWIVLRLLVNGS